ncbi:MAG: tetratricopeptide repeat protein [Chloroflexota bacterium]|nr:tetratricopeptide repeat protein [Chloroflexota bacterium]
MKKGCLLKLEWVAFVVFVLLTSGLLGAWMGYQDGLKANVELAALEAPDPVREQFELGLLDYEFGRYELARQRFEYVLAQAPDEYPQAEEYLDGLDAVLNITATLTLTPVPATITPTPTPDTRAEKAIYASAQSFLAAGDWDAAIDTLIALRNKDLHYLVYEVDDSFYTALRNRGEDKILHQGDLEGGIYDLSLAEKFGPLDYQATVYRDWARLYLTALGFWEAYPAQAVYYFGQIASSVPGLRDSVGWTAATRYRLSLIHYGDQLAAEGQWCDAQAQYETSLDMYMYDVVVPTLTYVAHRCATSTPTYSPPTQQTATDTVSPTSTNTLIPGLTATSTPTFTKTSTSSPTSSGATSTSTFTQTATQDATATATQTSTSTPLPTNTPQDTATPLPTSTNTPVPVDTPTPPE